MFNTVHIHSRAYHGTMTMHGQLLWELMKQKQNSKCFVENPLHIAEKLKMPRSRISTYYCTMYWRGQCLLLVDWVNIQYLLTSVFYMNLTADRSLCILLVSYVKAILPLESDDHNNAIILVFRSTSDNSNSSILRTQRSQSCSGRQHCTICS